MDRGTDRRTGLCLRAPIDREHLREFAHATYLDRAYVDLTPSRNHALGADLVDGFPLLSLLVHFEFAVPLVQTDGRCGSNYGLDRGCVRGRCP